MKIVKAYLNDSKESIPNYIEQGLTEEQAINVFSALYEVEFLIDADTGEICAVNEHPLAPSSGGR
jgi:hypothetical protein